MATTPDEQPAEQPAKNAGKAAGARRGAAARKAKATAQELAPARAKAARTKAARAAVGQHPNSRANLAKGGGKKGKSGRRRVAFELLAKQLLDENVEVQSTFEEALKDRFTKGYTGNVRLAAQLAGKLKPEASLQPTVQFLVVVPAVPGSVEEWAARYAPPEALRAADELGAGRDLSAVPEAELGLEETE